MVRKKTIGDYVILVIMVLICITILFPIVHLTAVSFSDKSAVAAGKVLVWPVNFTVFAYQTVMKDKLFFTSFIVSVKRVILGLAVNFSLTIITAFPLSRRSNEFRARSVYMWVLVFTMLFSGGLIPWYLNIKALGLLNSIWALILPGAVPVFSVVVLMNYFRGLPKELDEAAIVDGVGPWRLMLSIYLPMALPSLATISLFSIVGHWNAFFDGLVLMNTQEKYPLQTYLNQIMVQMTTNTSHMTREEIIRLSKISDKTINAAKILVSMIPILIVYPFLQKYFVTGLTLGSVKE